MFITPQLLAFNDVLNRPGLVSLIKVALITNTGYIFLVKGQFSIGSTFVYFIVASMLGFFSYCYMDTDLPLVECQTPHTIMFLTN